jgi:hypothetical protein
VEDTDSPSGFDQDTPRLTIASLGDAAAVAWFLVRPFDVLAAARGDRFPSTGIG